jgi:pimeloyl-ACP methyl ester carboxylesterase
VIPWGHNASLASTQRALPDADASTWEFAWRRWRDESAAVMATARGGVVVDPPACPLLVLASEDDVDVPPAISTELAMAWSGSLLRLPGTSHVGPLLGRSAARCAELVLGWLRHLPTTR